MQTVFVKADEIFIILRKPLKRNGWALENGKEYLLPYGGGVLPPFCLQ